MYLTRSLRVIAPALLGIFSVALPASANTVNTSVRAMHTPTIVGLCNLTFVSPLTRGEQRMNLILENGNGGYSALLPGRSSTVSLDAVTFDGTTLRASASTTAGTGALELHVSELEVTGTLTIGTQIITIKRKLAQ
jgi:hypothetical protein